MRSFVVSVLHLTVLIGLSVCSTSVHASQLFNFVQDGTGDVLGTLEVLELPANEISDFGDFLFTPEGDAIFGLGVGDGGLAFTSNMNGGPIAVDIVGGALGTVGASFGVQRGALFGIKVDSSSGSTQITDFNIEFPTQNQLERSALSILVRDTMNNPLVGPFTIDGELIPVPEPCGSLLVVLAAMLFSGSGERKRII